MKILARISRRLKSVRQAIKTVVCLLPRFVYRANRRHFLLLLVVVAIVPFPIILRIRFSPAYDVVAADQLAAQEHLLSSGEDAPAASRNLSTTATTTEAVPTFGQLGRPLIFVTFSYHASPATDLADFLRPLGVRVIDWGPNAYGCRYFHNCRAMDQLKVAFLFK
jgi:hypothetical protein